MSDDPSGQDPREGAGSRLEERFRLALSWREKARCEGGTAQAAAESCYERLCETQHHRVAWAAGRLRNAHDRQQTLQRQVARREVGAARANRLNRGLHQRIEACRREIALGNRLLRAESPADLGGFIDLPMGAYRRRIGRQEPRILRRFDRQDRVALVIAAVFLVASVAVGAYFTLWEREVGFEVLPTAEPNVLLVQCTNHGAQPVTLHVPWGEGRETAGRWQYGLKVLVREKPAQRFRLLPSEGPAWTHEGRATHLTGPIDVAPGLTIRLRLDIGKLNLPSGGYDAVRVVASRASGRTVYVYTHRNAA